MSADFLNFSPTFLSGGSSNRSLVFRSPYEQTPSFREVFYATLSLYNVPKSLPWVKMPS
jgi:hypothetical protein